MTEVAAWQLSLNRDKLETKGSGAQHNPCLPPHCAKGCACSTACTSQASPEQCQYWEIRERLQWHKCVCVCVYAQTDIFGIIALTNQNKKEAGGPHRTIPEICVFFLGISGAAVSWGYVPAARACHGAWVGNGFTANMTFPGWLVVGPWSSSLASETGCPRQLTQTGLGGCCLLFSKTKQRCLAWEADALLPAPCLSQQRFIGVKEIAQHHHLAGVDVDFPGKLLLEGDI